MNNTQQAIWDQKYQAARVTTKMQLSETKKMTYDQAATLRDSIKRNDSI